MHLGADMMGDQPDDPLAIGCAHQTFGRRETLAQPVHPEPPVGVEHDFDDIGLVEPAGDVAAKRSAQHARAVPGLRVQRGRRRPGAEAARGGVRAAAARRRAGALAGGVGWAGGGLEGDLE